MLQIKVTKNLMLSVFIAVFVSFSLSHGQYLKMVKDLNPGGAGVCDESIYYNIVFNDNLYLNGDNGSTGNELFRITNENEMELAFDFTSGTGDSYKGPFIIFNNKIILQMASSDYGRELFAYDGVNAPTLIKDINPGTEFSNPRNFTIYNGKLYFGAKHVDHGTELWEWDGVNEPTMIEDINPDRGTSYLWEMCVFNGKLYITANTLEYGVELYVYDGGSKIDLATDIYPGAGTSYPHDLTVFNGCLYFAANDIGGDGAELYKYDGINPPVMVYNIDGPDRRGEPKELIVFNDKLYFNAKDEAEGEELWVYDGINDPHMVAAITPGPHGSYPASFTLYNKKLFFSALQLSGVNNYDYEIWCYDGVNDPYVITDITPSDNGRKPKNLIVFQDALYFTAYNQEYGREYYKFVDEGVFAQQKVLGAFTQGELTGARYLDESTNQWVIVTEDISEQVAGGDIDGDGKDDYAAVYDDGNISGYTWIKLSTGGDWVRLTKRDKPTWITCGDVDGDGKDEFLGAYPGLGLYYWEPDNNGRWVQISSSDVDQVTTGDLDANGTDDVIVVYQNAVWVRYNLSGPFQLIKTDYKRPDETIEDRTPHWISAGDFNNDGKDEFVGCFRRDYYDLIAGQTPFGLCYLNLETGLWRHYSTDDHETPSMVACGDINGDGIDDLVAHWEELDEIWRIIVDPYYHSSSTFELVTEEDPDWITLGDWGDKIAK